MIKIEIKDSVKIIENRNKIHYFGIEIFNFYFIELFLSYYPVFVFIDGIIIITYAIFMKIRIFHTLHADWL